MALPHLAPYDPLDPAHHADPAARLAEARDHCPVSQPHPGVIDHRRRGFGSAI